MKNQVTLACVLLLALGCKKQASRAPAQEAALPSAGAAIAIDAAVDLTQTMSAAARAKLVAEIFEDRAVVYSSATGAIVWADSYHTEGYGDTTVLMRVGQQDAKTLAEFPIGSDEFDEQKAAAATLVGDVVAKGSYVQLERVEWDEGGTLDLASIGCELHWEDMRLSISKGASKAHLLESYEPNEPHIPVATAVYSKEGVPVIVVEITYDPGEQYHEGYTINRVKEVFAIPE